MTLVAVISLRVSVPVLSEQITVTEPSVSTAGRRRTIARLRAIVRVPMASTMVTIAGSPSGMAATASPTTARKISSIGMSRRKWPNRNVSRPSATMNPVIWRANWSRRRVSGVTSDCTSPTSVPMRPISVSCPVATTSPRAWPKLTTVPAYAMQERSARAASAATAAVSFSTGTDSPVSAASLILRFFSCISRRSAGTRAPDSSSTMSPGTSRAASISWRSPPRSTVARLASIACTASSACSALPSWMKPISAFTSTTPMITPASM